MIIKKLWVCLGLIGGITTGLFGAVDPKMTVESAAGTLLLIRSASREALAQKIYDVVDQIARSNNKGRNWLYIELERLVGLYGVDSDEQDVDKEVFYINKARKLKNMHACSSYFYRINMGLLAYAQHTRACYPFGNCKSDNCRLPEYLVALQRPTNTKLKEDCLICLDNILKDWAGCKNLEAHYFMGYDSEQGFNNQDVGFILRKLQKAKKKMVSQNLGMPSRPCAEESLETKQQELEKLNDIVAKLDYAKKPGQKSNE